MTPEAQRIAIAEACGWKFDRGSATSPGPNTVDVCSWFRERDTVCSRLPNFLRDLNAMHSAVMAQTPELRMSMNDMLMQALDTNAPFILDRTINATAAQRAEAFLRTIGKWEDSE